LGGEEKLKEKKGFMLRNIHHVRWSKKFLDPKNEEVNLHGTYLNQSVNDLMLLLPLGASKIKKLDLR
jgi:hypothetical protein